MKRGRARYVWLAGLACAAAVWAQGPWRTKPPQQWSQKEAKKILSDSPWAQTVVMPYHPLTDSAGRPETRSRIQIGRLPPEVEIEESRRRDNQPDWVLIVLWSSSRTIRRAIAVEAAKGTYVADPQDDKTRRMIEISVTSATRTQELPAWREAELMRNAWLKFGESGPEISPEQVMVDPYPGSSRAASYTFRFPRADAEGNPFYREGLKEIHFYCQLGSVGMQAKFQPAKMVAHDGPDW